MVEFTSYWTPFDCMFMINLFWVSTYTSEVFQLVCDCLPYSPFQWTFYPNLRLLFFNSLMIIFSQGECPKMFMRSMIILPRISKSLSVRLIGFWRLWLFNYQLTFTLSFLTLNSMYWHGTKGIPSLDVSWAYFSNLISIRWGKPKFYWSASTGYWNWVLMVVMENHLNCFLMF